MMSMSVEPTFNSVSLPLFSFSPSIPNDKVKEYLQSGSSIQKVVATESDAIVATENFTTKCISTFNKLWSTNM